MVAHIVEFICDYINKSGVFDEGVVRIQDFIDFIDGVLREAKNSIRKYKMSGIIDKPVQTMLRWLKKAFRSLKKLRKWLYALARDRENRCRTTYLIVDDTIVPRWSKKAYGVSKFYDHSEKKYVHGHNLVSLVFRNAELLLELEQQQYLSEDFIERWDEKTGEILEFKKKTEIVIEMLKDVQKNGIRACFLADAGYACKAIIAQLREISTNYVLGCKKNKNALLFGQTKRLDNVFAKTETKYFHLDGDKFIYVVKTLNITEWGRHRVLMIKQEDDEAFRFFITNKLNMKPINMWRHYKNRWCIEQHYRDVKQHLGMHKFFVWSKDSVISYFNFVSWLFNMFSLHRYEQEKQGLSSPLESIIDDYKRTINLIVKKVLRGLTHSSVGC